MVTVLRRSGSPRSRRPYGDDGHVPVVEWLWLLHDDCAFMADHHRGDDMPGQAICGEINVHPVTLLFPTGPAGAP